MGYNDRTRLALYVHQLLRTIGPNLEGLLIPFSDFHPVLLLLQSKRMHILRDSVICIIVMYVHVYIRNFGSFNTIIKNTVIRRMFGDEKNPR